MSLFFSPPSDCSSLPSTMTWAPCPHGVRTRGKKSLASLLNLFATPSDAYTHCKEQHSAKALHPNSRQPGAETLFSNLQSRKALSEMPTTVAGNLTMRSCRQFCHASAPMSLIPDSTLTCRKRGTPAKAPSATIHGDMSSKRNMMDRASFKLFLRWQDYTAILEDNGVCHALL